LACTNYSNLSLHDALPISLAEAVLQEKHERLPVALFVKLLLPDLLFTTGEGAVVALMQLFFILRFNLLPGPLGIIFTISGLAGGDRKSTRLNSSHVKISYA